MRPPAPEPAGPAATPADTVAVSPIAPDKPAAADSEPPRPTDAVKTEPTNRVPSRPGRGSKTEPVNRPPSRGEPEPPRTTESRPAEAVNPVNPLPAPPPTTGAKTQPSAVEGSVPKTEAPRNEPATEPPRPETAKPDPPKVEVRTPDEDSLREAVHAYGRALSSGNRDAVRKIFPEVAERELREIDSLRDNFGRDRYGATVSIRDIRLEGTQARVDCTIFHNGIDNTGKTVQLPQRVQLRFAWTGSTWIRVR